MIFMTSNRRSLKMTSKKRFTLLELLVAMAVFAVMMTVLMQFFGSAQKVSKRTGDKIKNYEDARIALEMISRDLKTVKYVPGGTFSGGTLSFYCRSAYASTPGEKVFVSYSGTGTLAYSCGGSGGPIAKNVVGFKVTKEGGDSTLPNNVTVELKVGESATDCNTFVKSVYIGGRGQ